MFLFAYLIFIGEACVSGILGAVMTLWIARQLRFSPTMSDKIAEFALRFSALCTYACATWLYTFGDSTVQYAAGMSFGLYSIFPVVFAILGSITRGAQLLWRLVNRIT